MKNKFFLLGFAFLLFSSCKAQIIESDWNIAPHLGDGLEGINPISVGINEDSLIALFDLIRRQDEKDFRSLIIIKDGKLAVEQYFHGYWRTNIHDVRSAGKSITSMLAGVAMDKGLFKPTDKVVSFFPEYKNLKNPSSEKSSITVEDLLIMSAGLASDDYQDDSPGTEGLMTDTEDYLKFILDLPMEFKPGERYAYSSAIAFLLGAIVEKTSGMTLEDFGRKHLFGPMKIKEFYWQKSPKGITTGMGNLYLQARDFAKLGKVMLDGGKWNDQQLLSKDFVTRSAQKRLDIEAVDPFAHGYGYMWYIAKLEVDGKNIDFYFASGNGGNKIFVIPSLDMVVSTMSSAYGQGYGQVRSHKILEKVLEATEK